MFQTPQKLQTYCQSPNLSTIRKENTLLDDSAFTSTLIDDIWSDKLKLLQMENEKLKSLLNKDDIPKSDTEISREELVPVNYICSSEKDNLEISTISLPKECCTLLKSPTASLVNICERLLLHLKLITHPKELPTRSNLRGDSYNTFFSILLTASVGQRKKYFKNKKVDKDLEPTLNDVMKLGFTKFCEAFKKLERTYTSSTSIYRNTNKYKKNENERNGKKKEEKKKGEKRKIATVIEEQIEEKNKDKKKKKEHNNKVEEIEDMKEKKESSISTRDTVEQPILNDKKKEKNRGGYERKEGEFRFNYI